MHKCQQFSLREVLTFSHTLCFKWLQIEMIFKIICMLLKHDLSLFLTSAFSSLQTNVLSEIHVEFWVAILTFKSVYKATTNIAKFTTRTKYSKPFTHPHFLYFKWKKISQKQANYDFLTFTSINFISYKKLKMDFQRECSDFLLQWILYVYEYAKWGFHVLCNYFCFYENSR